MYVKFINKVQNQSIIDKYFENSRIYGVDYQTYSHSFLCWGVNEFQDIYHSYLIIVICLIF